MTTHAEAVRPTLDALDELDTLRAQYQADVGTTSVTVRSDMVGGIGLVMTYVSTTNYMLESRASGDGRFMHRVNHDHYASAADIPTKYRKARAVALKVEALDASPLIEAQRAHAIAYAEYRKTGL